MTAKKECELLKSCSFFTKYKTSQAALCRGLIMEYCLGTKRQSCQRLKYRQEHGVSPEAEVMPNGRRMPS